MASIGGKVDHVLSMLLDTGQKWNLSRADKEALRHVLGLVNTMAAELADYTGFPIPDVVKRHEAIVSSNEARGASVRSGDAKFASRVYVALEDDDELIDNAWVFANFRSMGPQYSARRHRDCEFLVWENRFERFTLWNNPVPQLKTRGDVRMLLFVLAGITDLTKEANSGE